MIWQAESQATATATFPCNEPVSSHREASVWTELRAEHANIREVTSEGGNLSVSHDSTEGYDSIKWFSRHQNLWSQGVPVGSYPSAAAHTQELIHLGLNTTHKLHSEVGIFLSCLIQKIFLIELIEKRAQFSVPCSSFPKNTILKTNRSLFIFKS